jgi:catechol 2,3-dioxygenase-like lactoylglutathione lyase family enzyme
MGRVNHVSVAASDLDASADFYGRLIGAVRVPAPDFPREVRWLSVGDTHLHLFDRQGDPAPRGHHFGVEVELEQLVAAYRLAEERDAFDDDIFGNRLIELPGDVVQLYVRDPDGNLVELDAVGAGELPDDLKAKLRVLTEHRPQSGEHLDARLPIGAERPAPV